MTRMKSLAVAAVAAFGITVTPMPAAADSSDVAKVLGGLAVLGIIAKVADDRRDRRREAASQAQIQRQVIETGRRENLLQGELRRAHDRKIHRRQSFKNKRLPERCLRIAETFRGDRLVYAKRCLNRHFQHANRLPDRCERRIETHRGIRTVFGTRCLRRQGWNVASQ